MAEAVPAAGGTHAPTVGARRGDDLLDLRDGRRAVDAFGGEGEVPGPIAAKVVVARHRLDRHTSRHSGRACGAGTGTDRRVAMVSQHGRRSHNFSAGDHRGDGLGVTARAAGVGRTDEIDAIRATVDAACAGVPSFLVISGEAGIGKTTLLDMALAPGGDSSFLVLRVTGDEAEMELDFGLIDQLVRGAGVPSSALEDLRIEVGTDPLDAGARLLRVFDALELAMPLIITIDDAHLADVGSMQAITFAARRLHRDRIALVIAGRPELTTRVPPGLIRLAERSGGIRQLAGLDAQEVAQLARRRLGRELPLVAAERLRAHTRGHPLHTASCSSNSMSPICSVTVCSRRRERSVLCWRHSWQTSVTMPAG